MPDAHASAAKATAQARGRKEYAGGMRYLVIVMLLAIVASLGSAALFMLRGQGDSRRMAKALGLRVGLSVALFLALMLGYYLGLFRPGHL